MKTKFFVGLTGLFFTFSVYASSYTIDSDHTFVMFKVSHMGFSHVYGRFTDVTGDFVLDSKTMSNSKVNLVIKTASIDTQQPKRDKHLKNSDFFDAPSFPEIKFTSNKIKALGKNKYHVEGVLLMRGKSKTIHFELVQNNEGKDPWGNYRTGGDATFTIDRTEFGMNWGLDKNIPAQVTLIVSIEGIRN